LASDHGSRDLSGSGIGPSWFPGYVSHSEVSTFAGITSAAEGFGTVRPVEIKGLDQPSGSEGMIRLLTEA
jgi:hypothetical protein